MLWKKRPVCHETAERLATEGGWSAPLARLLAQRDCTTAEEARSFMNPRLCELADPFLLPDMRKATNRIWQAIETHSAITVFGDYDVDGISAAALLTRVLNALGAQPASFIPCRVREGYGLTTAAAQRCIEETNPELIITVDCGSTAREPIEAALRHGIETIVTDHHEPGPDPAQPVALVNPKRLPDGPDRDLAGVGVVFKLCHALVQEGRERNLPAAHQLDLRDYLDLVALGTVADVVPLRGENRTLVRHGITRMQTTRNPGLAALMKTAGLQPGKSVHSWHIGFLLGPRINAVGRISNARPALDLLLTDCPTAARDLADELDAANQERRRIENEITEAAIAQIEPGFDALRDFGLVAAGENWHPGVVGIAASKLSARFNRPAVVIGFDGRETGRGSGRSVEGFNIHAGLERCAELLLRFGGHEQAVGLTIRPDAVAAFRTRFNTVAAEALRHAELRPALLFDEELRPEETGRELYDGIQTLQPFGQDNPEPVFTLCNLQTEDPPRVVGANHLKFRLKGGLNCIAFHQAAAEPLLKGPVDIAFTLQENEYLGRTMLQLNIQDIRPARI